MNSDMTGAGSGPQRPVPLQSWKVGVVGAGVMGQGIAQVMAQGGARVLLHDAQPRAASRAVDALGKAWQRLADKGRLAADEVSANRARIGIAQAIADMKDCDVVIEAIVERLDVKRALFAELEEVVRPDAVLATNTSSLSVTAIAAGCRHPGRIAGLHFFNPVPLMRIVEIIGGVRTARSTIERLNALVATTSHAGVEVQDSPGFLINHAGRGYTTEALRCVQDGVASFSEVDLIMREQVRFAGGGFRLGPFELLDLTGLDVSQAVMESIYRQFYEEPRFRPSVIGAQRMTAGLFGRKSGEGFYEYPAAGAPATSAASGGAAPAGTGATARTAGSIRVHVAPQEHAPSLPGLVERLGGSLVASAAETADGGLVLIAPLGEDATTCAVREGLPAERTVAIDTLFDPAEAGCRRRSLMPTVATAPVVLQSAASLFAADGACVSLLRDSTGFVAQRIIAMIVSIGSEIAQQRIARPADVDLAVRTGLGYPAGPLSMGDEIGAQRILQILQAIHAATGDPRYRPGGWLRRRALLGLSLLVED